MSYPIWSNISTMETTYGQQVAAEVRAEMARQRRTGADLARHLNRSQQTVSRRLNGESPWDVDDLAAVAAWLGVDLDRLLSNAGTAA